MQLDRTHVAIRLRTMSEIGDLALVMLRRYPASCASFAAGAALWAVANTLLLGWIPINEWRYGLGDEEAIVEINRYLAWMATLVMLQTPAAGALMTSYLGQAVFEETPSFRDVWHQTTRHWRRWLWALGVKRLAIPAMVIVGLRWGQPATILGDLVAPLSLWMTAAAVRAGRPFMPEILLLERCPLKSDLPGTITVAKRTASLHRPVAGDSSGRFMTVAIVYVGLFFSVFYTLIFIRGIAFGLWNYLDLVVLLVLFPMSLWCVAGVSVLVRFLVYLDTRIRLEGWEVELAMQAEALRQFGPDRFALNPAPPPAAGDAGQPTPTQRIAVMQESQQ